MPASFFEACGYEVAVRERTAALLWKSFIPSAAAPRFMERHYRFEPVAGKVVVVLFWSRSCLTTDTDAQRVREVAAEHGAAVLLREYSADDPAIRARYGIYRAIFIDGNGVSWGYEAPKEGLRAAIGEALARR
jgi:hypothetical protein